MTPAERQQLRRDRIKSGLKRVEVWVHTHAEEAVRLAALTPADATAALARIVREAEARGMERAADRARVYASNYEQSSDGRNTFILLAEWADAEAAAILARAEQIERESGA